MRGRAVVLAAAIVMAPLCARGADLVVWWDEPWYAQEKEALAEVVATFEQETGKQVFRRLRLSHQCGFASTVHGNLITENDQWRKPGVSSRSRARSGGQT
jgi:hypothetical protein